MQHKILPELKWLAAGFVAAAVLTKAAYYRESTAVALRTAASLYWLFVIPGYALMLRWRERIGLLERAFIGTTAAMALTGIASYYLGIAGLKLQNQSIILPAAIIAASLLSYLKSAAKEKGPEQQGQTRQQGTA